MVNEGQTPAGARTEGRERTTSASQCARTLAQRPERAIHNFPPHGAAARACAAAGACMRAGGFRDATPLRTQTQPLSTVRPRVRALRPERAHAPTASAMSRPHGFSRVPPVMKRRPTFCTCTSCDTVVPSDSTICRCSTPSTVNCSTSLETRKACMTSIRHTRAGPLRRGVREEQPLVPVTGAEAPAVVAGRLAATLGARSLACEATHYTGQLGPRTAHSQWRRGRRHSRPGEAPGAS